MAEHSVRDSAGVCEIVDVTEGSPAHACDVRPGDRVVSVNGVVPRDILEWRRAVDDAEVSLELLRDGTAISRTVQAVPGRPLGLSVSSAVFDRVHTCDNHCEFCFIYQLPKGMRRSLYLKDDDYRLSFLFGNFTTLTRFTEADLERVLAERLSPLHVSIHAADPWCRAAMLRNDRGGTSLRWVSQLIDGGIDVKMQIVLCPGVNDGHILDHTLASVVERYPGVTSIAIVPLGLSKHNTEARMRVHTPDEARQVAERIPMWQERFISLTGRRVVHASDEFYVLSGLPTPPAEAYEGFTMLEDGVGLVRSFIDDFSGRSTSSVTRQTGFFGAVDAASPTDYVSSLNPAKDTGLRAHNVEATPVEVSRRKRPHDRVVILTGSYGRAVIEPLVRDQFFWAMQRVEVREVRHQHFGGNAAVAGLLTYEDIVRATDPQEKALYLLPDVCLNDGRFLDGATIGDLRRSLDVEVLTSSGAALRHRLETLIGPRD